MKILLPRDGSIACLRMSCLSNAQYRARHGIIPLFAKSLTTKSGRVRDSSPGATQPHSLPKKCVAEQGGDALGGSALGAQSTVIQMGHSDSPSSGSIVRGYSF